MKFTNSRVRPLSILATTVVLFSQPSQATSSEVENVLKRNGLDNTQIMTLYRNGELSVKEDTQLHTLTLVNKAVVDTPQSTTRNAKYWYHAMPLAEYRTFEANGLTTLPCTQQYTDCKLTLEYSYTQKSLSKEKAGILIQFSTPKEGWLYEDFVTRHHCPVKQEGGGSFILGEKGKAAVASGECDKEYRGMGLGSVFNNYLKQKSVTPIIAYVLLTK
ncbi:hypothetical protein [Dickeya zeae]|uniref:hypothetical protein n=1 Tax=Dickeya zeae TaxID=204042 RepID=UPI000C9B7799|nr:hypothetical protein [Dickeya zeae]AUQ25330.1 hypothetical protein C1O30_09725 [Dickeya zeae]UJR58407.1 hypothetical protein HJ580_09605 [Dickeya zeae]